MLNEALALWRGPVYADFADEPFVQPAVARLTELRLVAVEDRAEALLALGEHDRLASELNELVVHHPLRERLRAVHMRALYRAGRQSDALASFQALRVRLRDELGAGPGPEVTDVHQAILRHDDGSAGSNYSPTATETPRRANGCFGRCSTGAGGSCQSKNRRSCGGCPCTSKAADSTQLKQ